MKWNIFSGARRITATLGILIVVVGAVVVATNKPHVTLYYQFILGDIPPKLVERCDSYPPNAGNWSQRSLADGFTYNLQLCFKAYKSTDGRMLVPYEVVGDTVQMNEPYSAEVSQYGKDAAANFIVPTSDLAIVEQQRSKERWKSMKEGVGAIAGALFLLYLFTAVAGWIIRGFMGVPAGMDERPKAST